MRRLSRTIIIFSVVFLSTAAANATSCIYTDAQFGMIYESAHTIFLGEPVSAGVDIINGRQYKYAFFKVLKSYKGQNLDKIKIYNPPVFFRSNSDLNQSGLIIADDNFLVHSPCGSRFYDDMRLKSFVENYKKNIFERYMMLASAVLVGVSLLLVRDRFRKNRKIFSS